jgi:hypothetical protein
MTIVPDVRLLRCQFPIHAVDRVDVTVTKSDSARCMTESSAMISRQVSTATEI